MPAPVSLVTGSVRGLGLAVARRLAARGDRVHVVYRGSEELAREREAEFPGRVHRADLAREEDADALVAAVLAKDGRLDHLVHAVGAYHEAPLADFAPRDWRAILASNVDSALLVARAARAALRDGGGSMVFFGCAGLAGLRARREAAVYAAAKSALLVLVRSMAVEEGPYGVRANMISPGVVPHEHAHESTLDPALVPQIPLGRPGRPEEAAAIADWLTSDGAAYTTGADVPLAGGWML